MRLGIDAANLRGGGGITHLVELLRAADPQAHGFQEVIVWGGRGVLEQLEVRPWLAPRHERMLDGSILQRSLWQRFRLSRMARDASCDLLFVPGGSYAGDFRPVVTMSRNMVPFAPREARRYGITPMRLRVALLAWTQGRTFRRAEGLIFLTRYAREEVTRAVGSIGGRIATISHGVDGRFACPPREQLPAARYSPEHPFRSLYVSTVDAYKHQWHVAEAIAMLRAGGLPIAVDFIGAAYPPSLRRLVAALHRLDPTGSFMRYLGPVPYAELPHHYREADLCVFASSVENMPNIVLESMASGLPIASSDRGPMPEILRDAAVYFDPESPSAIADAVARLFAAPELRARFARAAFERARGYTWRRCAEQTFAFLAEIAGRPATVAV